MNFPPKPTKPPAYTPEQRKQIAECFHAAKNILWDGVGDRDGKRAYICFAVARTQVPGWAFARDAVGSRLNPYRSLPEWLVYEAGVPWGELPDRALQQYRHAWLDSLIAEFEGTEE